jgi:hypothetical protein
MDHGIGRPALGCTGGRALIVDEADLDDHAQPTLAVS